MGFDYGFMIDAVPRQLNGTTWIKGVLCKGTEGRLLDCYHNPLELDSCSWSETIGVRCLSTVRAYSQTSVKKYFHANQCYFLSGLT